MLNSNKAMNAFGSFIKAHQTALAVGSILGASVGYGLYQRHKERALWNTVDKMWKNSHGYLQDQNGNIVAGY